MAKRQPISIDKTIRAYVRGLERRLRLSKKALNIAQDSMACMDSKDKKQDKKDRAKVDALYREIWP